MADRFNMSDVMISYSRQDKAFVEALERSIKQTGRETWVDWDDIPPTVDWWAEIKAGIEAAHVFVFIISPDSVNSDICYNEIDHAVLHNKRIVPIILQEIVSEADKTKMHPALNTHNWIYFRPEDNRDQSFRTFLLALDSDFDHVRQHTRLLVRANEWQDENKRGSLLLRSDDLRSAEAWIQASYNKNPSPTELQIEFIDSSRKRAARFLQLSVIGMATAMLILGLLSVFAFTQQISATNNLNTAIAADAGRLEAVAAADEARATQESARSNAELAITQQQLAVDERRTAEFGVTQAQIALGTAQSFVGNVETQAAVVQNLTQVAPSLAAADSRLVNAQAAEAIANAQAVEAQQNANFASTQVAVAQSDAAIAAEAQGTAVAMVATSDEILTQSAFNNQTQVAAAQQQVNSAATQRSEAAAQAADALAEATEALEVALAAQAEATEALLEVATSNAIGTQSALNNQTEVANARAESTEALESAATSNAIGTQSAIDNQTQIALANIQLTNAQVVQANINITLTAAVADSNTEIAFINQTSTAVVNLIASNVATQVAAELEFLEVEANARINAANFDINNLNIALRELEDSSVIDIPLFGSIDIEDYVTIPDQIPTLATIELGAIGVPFDEASSDGNNNSEWMSEDWLFAASDTFREDGLGWVVNPSVDEARLTWLQAIDLTQAERPQLRLSSLNTSLESSAQVHIRNSNNDWVALDVTMPSTGTWIPTAIDLSDYAGEVIYVRFVWQNDDSHHAIWLIDNVSVVDAANSEMAILLTP